MGRFLYEKSHGHGREYATCNYQPKLIVVGPKLPPVLLVIVHRFNQSRRPTLARRLASPPTARRRRAPSCRRLAAHERRSVFAPEHAQPPRRDQVARQGAEGHPHAERRPPAGGKPCAEASVKPSSSERHADTPSCGTSLATASVNRCNTRSSPCSSDSACPSSTSARPVRAAVRSSAHPPRLSRRDQRHVAGASQERGLVFGDRLPARAHHHPARLLLGGVAEPTGQVLAGAHRRDQGGDGWLDDAALRPRVVAAGQVLMHEHAVQPQPLVAVPPRGHLRWRAGRRPPQARSETRP